MVSTARLADNRVGDDEPPYRRLLPIAEVPPFNGFRSRDVLLSAIDAAVVLFELSRLRTRRLQPRGAGSRIRSRQGTEKSFPVLNPAASLEDMQRHVRGQPERFGCLAGYKFFYLDWHLDLYRCHNWDRPLCHIFEFDLTKRVHDGCTACMIDCYRDDSVMQHVAVAISDGLAAAKKGQFGEAWRRWSDRRNFISLKAVLDEAPVWRKRV